MKRLVVLLACIVFVCGICGDLGAETMLFFKNASVARGDVVRWELQPSSLGEVTFQGVGLKLADGVNPTLAARITAFPERFYLDTNYDPPKLMERLDDESEVEVDVDPPSVPTGVTVSPIVRGISVAVDHPADEEEVEFEVHASATQGFTPGPSTVKAFGSVSPFLIGNLDPGTYYVRARAKDGAGNWSDYCAEVSGQAGMAQDTDIERGAMLMRIIDFGIVTDPADVVYVWDGVTRTVPTGKKWAVAVVPLFGWSLQNIGSLSSDWQLTYMHMIYGNFESPKHTLIDQLLPAGNYNDLYLAIAHKILMGSFDGSDFTSDIQHPAVLWFVFEMPA